MVIIATIVQRNLGEQLIYFENRLTTIGTFETFFLLMPLSFTRSTASFNFNCLVTRTKS